MLKSLGLSNLYCLYTVYLLCGRRYIYTYLSDCSSSHFSYVLHPSLSSCGSLDFRAWKVLFCCFMLKTINFS